VLLVIALVIGGFLLASRSEAPSLSPDGEPELGLGEAIDLDAGGPFPLSPGLYVLDTRTSDVWRVLDQKGFDASSGASYQWSADGKWLVSTSVGNREKTIIVSQDGRERREVPGQSWTIGRLEDGSFVLHIRRGTLEDGSEILARLDLDSMTIEDLEVKGFPATVAPNGELVLHQLGDGRVEVSEVAPGQQEPLRVESTSTFIPDQRGSVWSPDSQRFVVAEYGPDDASLVVVDVDGSDSSIAIAKQASDASWSPDGRHLAYVVFDYAGQSNVAPCYVARGA
jgi:hypothetical protein